MKRLAKGDQWTGGPSEIENYVSDKICILYLDRLRKVKGLYTLCAGQTHSLEWKTLRVTDFQKTYEDTFRFLIPPS